MKKLIMAFWILAMLTLAACGGTTPTTAPTADAGGTTGGGGEASGDGPAAAVQAYIEAAFSGDSETATSLICDAAASSIQVPPAGGTTGAEFDFSGLTYTVSNETAETATVTVGGSYTVTISGVDTSAPIPDVPYTVRNENGEWKICA